MLEILIILYILYITYILKGTEHVAVVRSTRTVAAKPNNINGLQGFAKTQNMHNSVFRYKLDTNAKY